ncbi:PUR family DNA/RNA-binding protein [Chitinophaga nivalis]|uniref:PUR family DNA/RNA-binding protein n=1 Tax=Chitinophaga nivalis TaxID=2991709 RepID=A0ABT3ILD6_9BACT|nr:PUR family DNA/RNA-binding protein [Chitinophaga nivalis]MCW3484769.1 PUR family DNA/RNA-binding protein [Chitinophaga nivalis]
MAYENNNQQERNNDSIFSKRLKAGKRRTYFFDVKTTRGNDYFLTITESKKRFNDNGYDRHKVFLYKEDFNKFLNALTETINYVKTELMPDFDFDAYNHDYVQEDQDETEGAEVEASPVTETVPVEASVTAQASHSTDEVDKW